ncbi:MAG: hypothetical protein ACKVJG_09335 [Candidatus Latescibacterota bacterium]
MLAQLRRSAIRTSLAPEKDLFAGQRRIRDRARNTPYEAVAELELARCHLKRMQGEQALVIYKALEKKHTWLTCVLYSEIGVAHAMCENGMKAIKLFELAAEHTTPAAMATLKEVSEQLIGKQYWAFWCNVDNLETRQCQNYAWLARLYSASGQKNKSASIFKAVTRLLKQRCTRRCPRCAQTAVYHADGKYVSHLGNGTRSAGLITRGANVVAN